MSIFVTKTIEEVTETLIDYRGKTPRKTDSGIKLITAKIIKNGYVQKGNYEYISEETYLTHMRRGFPESGDILITTEAPLGEVAQLNFKEKIALAQRVILLRGNTNIINQKYYLFALQSPFVQGRLYSRATGTTVLGIKQTELRQVEIPLPPLPTQRKIAGILSAYDDLIENNTRRIEILEEMARMLYREWFVKFRFPVDDADGNDGDRLFNPPSNTEKNNQVELVESELGLIPKGWKVGRLDDALILQRGFDLPKSKRKEGNIPIYAATGIVGTHNQFKIKAPCVITGRSGSLGTVLYINEDFWALNTTLWVKEFKRVTPIYAFYLLDSLGLAQYNSGAAVPTLNRNNIHGLSVIIPDQKILKKFDEHISLLFLQKRNLQEKNINLRKTRDLLLPRLISGEIDVEDLDINTGEIDP